MNFSTQKFKLVFRLVENKGGLSSECGLVFEVVALWSNGVVWNNGGLVE